MFTSSQLPGRTVNIEDKEYLYFSGTSYLGITQNKKFRDYLMEGMERYGTNYGSSRISNLQLDIFEEAENELASMVGAASALTMSSGFLACQLVTSFFEAKGKFIYAPEAHPSLWRKAGDFFQQDYEQWVRELPDQLAAIGEESIIILTNAIDALHVRQHNFSWIAQLPDNKRYTIILDDSHGLGVTGENGEGIYSSIPEFSHITLIVVSSLGKALGIPGGVIFSDKETIRMFKSSAFFSSSSPVIPAYLYAYLLAKEVYEKQRKNLMRNIDQFSTATASLSVFQTFTDYPVFYTPENDLYSYLKKHSILISSFPYPSSQDKPVTRIVLNSLHTEEDIEKLVALVRKFVE